MVDTLDPDPFIDDADDPEAALREGRARFVADFPQKTHSIRLLIDSIGQLGPLGPIASLRQIVHRMTGLAGMVGFPTVSARASDLEEALAGSPETPANPASLKAGVAAIEAAFTDDLSKSPPGWATTDTRPASPSKVLIVEDDEEQRRILVRGLRSAGYRVAQAASGDEVVAVAKQEQPNVVLLDVELPGMDGHAVCRQLKADPELSAIPVVFLTTRTTLVDRLAGLTLGADDYLAKPYEPGEVLIRIRRLLARGPRSNAQPLGVDVLAYDAFVLAARETLARGPAALALVRTPADALAAVAQGFLEDLRRKDLGGRFSDTHLVLLLPDRTATGARDEIGGIVSRLAARGLTGVSAGVAAEGAGDSQSVEALLAEADLALAAARVSGEAVSLRKDPQEAVSDSSPTILIADDDPDVVHIIDPRLKAAGYRTLLAFDGEQTLRFTTSRSPALLVLDLMMPKLTGFDVLQRMRGIGGPRPHVIVMSARGREEDVTRAFDLGADDYITKPFSPQELVARVARLLR